jgi:transposase InsO family protein
MAEANVRASAGGVHDRGMDVDVLVIGAGLADLVAAKAMDQRASIVGNSAQGVFLFRRVLAGAATFSDEASCRREIFGWATRYNTRRRHSYLDHKAPDTYENTLAANLPEAA